MQRQALVVVVVVVVVVVRCIQVQGRCPCILVHAPHQHVEGAPSWARSREVPDGFEEPAARPGVWIRGVRVPEVVLQKYLGLMFDAMARAAVMAEDGAAAHAGVFFAVLRDMRATHEHVPHTLPVTISLLRGRAEAAGVHGCGLWGILLLPPKLRAVTDSHTSALSM
jgi:hypothetical protein